MSDFVSWDWRQASSQDTKSLTRARFLLFPSTRYGTSISCTSRPDVCQCLVVQIPINIMSKNKPSTSMTHVACESKLRSIERSFIHPWPRNWVTIGRAVVYYARAPHAFSAGIKCRHCIYSSIHSFIYESMYLSIIVPIYSSMYVCIHSFIHSYMHLFIYLCIHFVIN